MHYKYCIEYIPFNTVKEAKFYIWMYKQRSTETKFPKKLLFIFPETKQNCIMQ